MCVCVCVGASVSAINIYGRIFLSGYFNMAKARYSMGGTSVSQLHVRLRDDPTGPCSDDPNESDQSELSLTLLRTPIVRGGGKDSEVPSLGTLA